MLRVQCVVLIVLSVLGGCTEANLLRNGSFERGREPWFALESRDWAGFSISGRYAVDGRFAAHLALRGRREDQGAKIFGLIQEVSPTRFPKKVSGYYRVENWQRGTEKQYIQCVVIVWGDSFSPYTNIQIRYILAGTTEPPFEIANGRFVFLGGPDPPQGEWVRFERDVRADFLKYWGDVPEKFEKIRVLFEARYDQKKLGTELLADVYYDALYLGD